MSKSYRSRSRSKSKLKRTRKRYKNSRLKGGNVSFSQTSPQPSPQPSMQPSPQPSMQPSSFQMAPQSTPSTPRQPSFSLQQGATDSQIKTPSVPEDILEPMEDRRDLSPPTTEDIKQEEPGFLSQIASTATQAFNTVTNAVTPVSKVSQEDRNEFTQKIDSVLLQETLEDPDKDAKIREFISCIRTINNIEKEMPNIWQITDNLIN